MKLRDLRRYAKDRLSGGGIEDGDSSKLELLFEYAFNFTRNFLLSEPGFEVDEKSSEYSRFLEALEKTASGVPVQYATGFSYFCGNRFSVTPSVLIPRQETELLVRMAVDYLRRQKPGGSPLRVLDLCSGSGAIGISVKKEFPTADVTLSDISHGALEVSKTNAKSILGSETAVSYVHGNFLDPFAEGAENAGKKFDLILSNPPYVATEVYNSLPPDVKNFEPRIALDGGAGGLAPYIKITKSLRSVCNPAAAVMFEIGEDQGNMVKALLAGKKFGLVTVVRDLDGRDRFVCGTLATESVSETDPSFESAASKLTAYKNALKSAVFAGNQDVLPGKSPSAATSHVSGITSDAVTASSPSSPGNKQSRSKKEPAKNEKKPAEKSAPANNKSDKKDAGATTLLSPVTVLKGIGPVTAEALASSGVSTVGDLLSLYPSKYEDRTRPVSVNEARKLAFDALDDGRPAVSASMILRVLGVTERGNPRLPVIVVSCEDEQGERIDAVWFNNKYVKKSLHEDAVYCFYGRVAVNPDFFRNIQLVQPQFTSVRDKAAVSDFLTLRPVYRLPSGIKQKDVAHAALQAVDIFESRRETLTPEESAILPAEIPAAVRERYNVPALSGLFRGIHAPRDITEAENSRRRITFENLLDTTLCIHALKTMRSGSKLKGISFKRCDLAPLTAALPFTLTDGQLKVIGAVLDDMASPAPMNRLIDGDVGSGKTVIALAAVYNAIRNGYQAAFMVPSTVLAVQHMKKISDIFGGLGIATCLLYSSTPAREKREILERIKSGEPLCVVGTHSLISEGVDFPNLGLAVIDEQHRFGVLQRAAIMKRSSEVVPDVISLTATPIPRSLALVLYGDMDISVLDEKPAGRIPVSTYLYKKKERARIMARTLELVRQGGQAYIVHSCIDKSEITGELGLEADSPYAPLACTSNYEELSKTVFRSVKTGLIHGKMKDSEKKEVMESFARGETKVLFATTVIEVGIDVPNANIIVIEDADRFGLSTIHQLRGRVGRGTARSYCILVSDSNAERLKVLTETSDGFKIAEKDLELRGPGDFFGTSQTGRPMEELTGFVSGGKLLADASDAAKFIIKSLSDGTDPESAAYYDRVTEKAREVTL